MSKMSEMDMDREDGRFLSADFGLSVPPAPVEVTPDPPRTVETVTLEIRTLQRQAQQIMLGYAVEIGRRLEEVKAILPHGQWGDYLKNEVDYSQSTANNFMRIYREYGAAQQSLFGGEAKSQAFANLTYTKALRLLAEEVPHGVAVSIESMKEYDSICHIEASIICERDSHKGIIIGKGGVMLKKIGSAARREIEEMLEKQVNLKLFVKVKKDWRDSDYLLKNFGYNPKDISST